MGATWMPPPALTFDSINPATGKLLARVASGDTEDINRAVTAARAVFRKGSWANLAPAKRKRLLFRFAELITKHTEELALLETLDMGKPISDSLKVDIPGAARCIAVVRRGRRQDLRRGGAHRTRALWRPSRANRWASSARSCRGISRC